MHFVEKNINFNNGIENGKFVTQFQRDKPCVKNRKLKVKLR